MVLKVYGDWVQSVQRVICVLIEKGVPYEMVPISMAKGEHKSPQYLEKQPFGQLPYIDDDGFILYESRAICHYIALKYPDQGTPLLPTDLKENALFHQAASLEATHFDGPAVAAVVERFYKPRYFHLETNEELYEKAIADLSKELDVYDHILGKQKYLAGEKITLADIYHLPYGTLIGEIGSDIIATRPNVNRWFKELASRDSWKTVIQETNKA